MGICRKHIRDSNNKLCDEGDECIYCRLLDLERQVRELSKTPPLMRTPPHLQAIEIINSRQYCENLPKYQVFIDTREARNVDTCPNNLADAVGDCMSAQWSKIRFQVLYGKYYEGRDGYDEWLYTFRGVQEGGKGPLLYTEFMRMHIVQPNYDNAGLLVVRVSSILWMGKD